MPFSHHSHSGQFCGHAKDSLEDVVQEAISQKMQVFCMTEHMPRDLEEDLYPEEVDAGITPKALQDSFAAYMAEARRLRDKYRDQLTILIGTETDWIRPATCNASIQRLLSSYPFDLFVGSVHHVHTVPIDFDKELFAKAVRISVDDAAGSEECGESLLVADYFDLQLGMLQALRPPVVGHFDLIRLFADFEKAGESFKQWPVPWQKALRNLEYIRSYGGCLEINSAGLRKGLRDPYPCKDVCEAFLAMDGRFVLSDDSHGIAQVGHSYAGVIDFAETVGIREFAVFENTAESKDSRLGATASGRYNVEDIRRTGFMSRLQ